MDAIQTLRIPRCYLGTFSSSIKFNHDLPIESELHMFCDASELAYAAVAYWRHVFADNTVKVSLVCSKARVAPLKPVSIPRLELQGALVAARLADTICEAVVRKPSKRYYWCDSKNVLAWLRNDARNFKPFVAHRVGEIIEISSRSEWRWIPTLLNVADDATRICSGSLTMSHRWFQGPQFLYSSPANWPIEPDVSDFSCIDELKSTAKFVNINFIDETVPKNGIAANPNRFSSWLRFQRSTALAHKYLRQLRIRAVNRKGVDVSQIVWLNGCILSFHLDNSGNRSSISYHLTAEDLELARLHIFRTSQFASFQEEIRCLRTNTPLPRNSKLRKVESYLDSNDLLRLRGRACHIKDVDLKVNSPIVLDGNHKSIELLIHHYHQKAAHANTETVYNEMLQEFYIFRLRSRIKMITRRCQFCRIRKAIPSDPSFGILPFGRVAHHTRPFTFCGLDYFGPIVVSVGRRTEKRYVALFTCLTTRALHLEVVQSLSADSAVLALRRFISRRGTPTEVWSDNGTAFVGAAKELREFYGQSVADQAANNGIKWRFIPPAAPFMGGVWERLVRSVKTALKVTLRERKPRDELLSTLLAEAESLINSRPLTYVASDINEEALTPNHFLLGSSSNAPISVSLTDRDLCGRSNWKKVMRLSDHFGGAGYKNTFLYSYPNDPLCLVTEIYEWVILSSLQTQTFRGVLGLKAE